MFALGIALNTVVLIFSIFTVFPGIANSEILKNIFCITIIALQLLSIIVGNKYQKMIENNVITGAMNQKESKKELIEKLVPYKKKSILGAREEMRKGLIALTTVFIICCIYWSVMTGEVRKFIVVVCVVSIAFIYADYVTNNSFYSKKYDENMLEDKNETPNSIRGLARIYRHEYKNLQFKRFINRNKYKELSTFINPSVEWKDNKNLQDMCIKYILFSKVDAIKNPELYYGAIIAFFNVLLIIPNVPEIVCEKILPFEAETSQMIIPYVLIAVNIIFSVANIVSMSTYRDKCKFIVEIAKAIGDNGDPAARYKLYQKLEKSYDFKVIRARGIYMFNSEAIDAGEDLDEFLINIANDSSVDPTQSENDCAFLKYRMLYIHRFHTNFQRFVHTVILSYIALFFLLSDIGIELYIIGIVFAVISVLVLIFGIFVLPNIARKRIADQCRILNGKSKKSMNSCDA